MFCRGFYCLIYYFFFLMLVSVRFRSIYEPLTQVLWSRVYFQVLRRFSPPHTTHHHYPLHVLSMKLCLSMSLENSSLVGRRKKTSWMNFCSSSVKLPLHRKKMLYRKLIIFFFKKWSDQTYKPSHVPRQESCSLLNSFYCNFRWATVIESRVRYRSWVHCR